MDKKSAIFTRRSIRVYDPSKRATKEQILDILDAAMHAPTAMNKQPWEFVVATDPEVVNAITKIHPYCEFLPDAEARLSYAETSKNSLKYPKADTTNTTVPPPRKTYCCAQRNSVWTLAGAA